MRTITGIPSGSAPKKSVKPWLVMIWVLRSAMSSARPRAEASIASVAMNGTTLPYAISTPLTSPQAAPTTTAVNTMAIQPMSSAIACVPVVVAHTDASARIAPTDRSMPPPVITKVMPIADDAEHGGEAQDRHQVVGAGEPVAGRDDADDAQQDQRDDESEIARHAEVAATVAAPRGVAGRPVNEGSCFRASLMPPPPRRAHDTEARREDYMVHSLALAHATSSFLSVFGRARRGSGRARRTG